MYDYLIKTFSIFASAGSRDLLQFCWYRLFLFIAKNALYNEVLVAICIWVLLEIVSCFSKSHGAPQTQLYRQI